MQWKAFAVVAALATAACAAPAVISDINDSSLKIQVNNLTPETEIAQKAREGCGLYNKTPVPISHRCMDGYCMSKEILFACK
jgi:hypothetical protein